MSRLAISSSLVLILAMSCSKPSDPNPFPKDIIPNGSFEVSGSPSWNDWIPSDTSLVQIIADSPSGGGSWGLAVSGDGIVGHGANYSFQPPGGTHRYRLSIWGKATADSVGSVLLRLVPYPNGDFLPSFELRIRDTSWTYYSVEISFDGTPAQSVFVRLWAPGQGTAHFDLAKLEQLD